MSSNITGVENLKDEVRKDNPLCRCAGAGECGSCTRASSRIDRAFQLGRLDGGAYVAGRVEEQAKEDRCDGDHEEPCTICAMDSVADDLVETVKDALSILEKEAKGEKE